MERMYRIEQRKEWPSRIEVFNGKNKCLEHPRFG